MKRFAFRSRRGEGKVSPRLVALSSSVILAVYAAGWAHVRQLQGAAFDETDRSSLSADVSRTTLPRTSLATDLPSATSPSAAPSPQATPEATYRDGTYSGSGEYVHGGVTVRLVISGGHIVSAQITDCNTRYPCSEIESLPGQTLERQSARLRYVTGATDSSRAYVRAVAAALEKAAS